VHARARARDRAAYVCPIIVLLYRHDHPFLAGDIPRLVRLNQLRDVSLFSYLPSEENTQIRLTSRQGATDVSLFRDNGRAVRISLDASIIGPTPPPAPSLSCHSAEANLELDDRA